MTLGKRRKPTGPYGKDRLDSRARRKQALKAARTMARRKRLNSKTKPEVRELRELMRKFHLIRDGFKCLRCGASPDSRIGTVLQGAHIYGKGKYRAMEYIPENVITLCKSCHFGWWHDRGGLGNEALPIDHPERGEVRKWCVANLGREYMQRLDLMAQTPSKCPDRALVKLWLSQQLAKLTGFGGLDGDEPKPDGADSPR